MSVPSPLHCTLGPTPAPRVPGLPGAPAAAVGPLASTDASVGIPGWGSSSSMALAWPASPTASLVPAGCAHAASERAETQTMAEERRIRFLRRLSEDEPAAAGAGPAARGARSTKQARRREERHVG